jgi:hypothetical protein
MDPDSAVEREVMSKEQTLPQRRQCVSTYEKAATGGALRNHVKQMEGRAKRQKRL